MNDWLACFLSLQRETHRPSNQTRLGKWIYYQRSHYKFSIGMMKEGNPHRQLWEEFVRTHSDWFDRKRVLLDWNKCFNELKQWHYRPSKKGFRLSERRLAVWVEHQQNRYIRQKEKMKQYVQWSEFVKTHPTWFNVQSNSWNQMFNTVQQWPVLPSVQSEDKQERQLGRWVERQELRYRQQQPSEGDDNDLLWKAFRNSRPSWFLPDLLFDQFIDFQSDGQLHPFFR